MIGGFQIGPFQTNYQQVSIAPVIVSKTPSGVRGRKYRVRRSDFTSDETYQLALRAALQNANFAVRKFDDIEIVKVEARRPQKTGFVATAKSMTEPKKATVNEVELMQMWMEIDE